MNDNVLKYTQKLDIGDDKESLPEIEIEEPEVNFNENQEDDIIDDYKYSRQKLMYAITASEAVMKHAIRDMSNNPGPRPIEAFSTLMKTMNETTDRIFSLHEKMQKVKPKKDPSTTKDENGKPTTVRATINDIIEGMNES